MEPSSSDKMQMTRPMMSREPISFEDPHEDDYKSCPVGNHPPTAGGAVFFDTISITCRRSPTPLNHLSQLIFGAQPKHSFRPPSRA